MMRSTPGAVRARARRTIGRRRNRTALAARVGALCGLSFAGSRVRVFCPLRRGHVKIHSALLALALLGCKEAAAPPPLNAMERSEEHTSELQSLMRISYAVFCLQKKNTRNNYTNHQ